MTIRKSSDMRSEQVKARVRGDQQVTCVALLSLHNPVARAARALVGRYTVSEATVRILSRARTDILV